MATTPGGFHRADRCQFFAFAAFRDCADREHVDCRQATRAFDDVVRDRGAVIDGFRIRHAADGREPSSRCGPRSAFNRFGVFEPRLAQMHVHIDEAGRHDEPRRVEYLRACSIEVRPDFSDDAIAQQHIRDFIAMAGGIEHASVP